MPQPQKRFDTAWFWAHFDEVTRAKYNPETGRFDGLAPPQASGTENHHTQEKGGNTMSTLIAKGDQRQRYPILDAGGYIARCYAIADIGEQFSPMYGKSSRKVIFMWEIPSETIDVEGELKPRAISETYTMSLGEKSNLRKMLENWRGRAFTAEELNGFDLEKVLGVPCMLNVIHKAKQNGEPFAAIGSVSKLPKGMSAPELFNPPVLFSLADADALERMTALPEWIQNRIRESATYKDLTQPDRATTDASADEFTVIAGGEDIPF